ncbi:hypothetical protein MNBD_ALPHA09-2375 [hydrothermal vent metagenome]|uniref:Gfo/Idh/MocA family oxidoreductase n=1 Tax=hydrothermal vent metagenome TaxID=652676 RepID=A0A3B0TXX3_9ZZZZ
MASRQDTRVLQIGCGNFGPAHISAWHALGLDDRLYVADPEPEARALAGACGVPEANLTGDFKEFLDAADIVDIVVPLPAHLSIAQAALAAGKHVALEKPATRGVSEARQLVDHAQEAGTKVQIGYHMRFHPLAAALKQLITDGDLGRPVYLAAQTCGFKRLRADTGVLLNDAVHFIDLVRWLLGMAPQSVYAVLRDDLGCGVPSLALIVLDYEDGAVARIEAGRTGIGHRADPIVPNAWTSQVFSIVGSHGAAEIDFHAGTLLRRGARFCEKQGIWQPEFGDASFTEGMGCAWADVMARAFAAFLHAIENDTASPVPVGEAALEMAVLCEAIERSARTGVRIFLKARS